MTLQQSIRIITALPFLYLFYSCLMTLDIGKLVAHQQPFLDSGRISWEGGSVPILANFHPTCLRFLDEVWRGTTVTFSPSTLGYDEVAWWQMFTFLNDLGVLMAVWIIESCRVGNMFTAGYL
jgi:hypothetical protein